MHACILDIKRARQAFSRCFIFRFSTLAIHQQLTSADILQSISTMKFLALASLLATVAIASPIAITLPEAEGSPVAFHEVDESIVKRQGVGSTANELENGACRRITFIFARGSTEPGNLVCVFLQLFTLL